MADVKKSEMLNNEALDKVYPTSMNVGGHNVEIRSYKETAGHDDSQPYQAKVYVDGKECGVVYNDGWGGETNVQATKEKAFPVLREVEKYVRDHQEEFPMGEYMGIKLNHTSLSSICDKLAMNCALRQDALKYADKALLVHNPKKDGVIRVTFTKSKRDKLKDLIGSHQFKTMWYDTIAKYEEEGCTILSVQDIFTLLRA